MHIKRIYVILTLLSALMTLPAGAYDNANIDAILIDAVSLYNEGKLDDARVKLRQILSGDPDNDAALYYLGICDFTLGDVESAEIHLRRAVEVDPHNYWYKDRLARLYSATGRPELTTEIYEGLLADYPKKTELYYALVNLYGQQGKTDKLLSTLDEIDAVNGKDEMVALARYDVLSQLQRTDEAFEALEAYNREFTSARVLSVMGDANLAQYKDSLALGYYEEALAEEPSNPSALIGKSEVFRIRRDYPSFFSTLQGFFSDGLIGQEDKTRYLTTLLQHLDQHFVQTFRPQLDSLVGVYVAAAPADSTTLQTAGSYFFSTSRPEKAGEFFVRNRDNHPDNLSARMLYARYLAYCDKWLELTDEAEQCVSLFPQETDFIEMKSLAYYNMEDFESAIRENERLLAVAPGDSAVVLHAYAAIGDMRFLLGDVKKAYKAYDSALKVNPEYAPVLNNYAYYLCLEKKKLSKAYQMSKVTITAEPDNPTYLDTFGWILYTQGKPAEAKAYFKHAMLYGGKEQPSVLDHYAEVLYALKEYDLAVFYWDLAKAKNVENEVPDLEERVKARLEAIGR